MYTLLAATDLSLRSAAVLPRTRQLARALGGDLSIVHVLDDDGVPETLAIADASIRRSTGAKDGELLLVRGGAGRSTQPDGGGSTR